MTRRTIVIPLLLLFLTACTSTQRPTTPRTEHISSFDGVDLVVDIRGEGEPALVFIHGWCCNRGHWEHQVDVLDDEYTVVAIDLGGHGESGRDRTDWSLRAIAHDVQAVVEHLDLQRVILIGHSMGGPVSLYAAEIMPERVIGIIGVDTLQDAEFTYNEEMFAMVGGAIDADFEGFLNQFVTQMSGQDPALTQRIVREALLNDPAMASALMRSFGDYDVQATFRACPSPIRCINAAGPNQTKIDVNRKYTVSYDAVLIEDVGHWPMLEKPDEFNAHLSAIVVELDK